MIIQDKLIPDLIKNTPNDGDLGKVMRPRVDNGTAFSIPNNQDLGKHIRACHGLLEIDLMIAGKDAGLKKVLIPLGPESQGFDHKGLDDFANECFMKLPKKDTDPAYGFGYKIIEL